VRKVLPKAKTKKKKHKRSSVAEWRVAVNGEGKKRKKIGGKNGS